MLQNHHQASLTQNAGGFVNYTQQQNTNQYDPSRYSNNQNNFM